MAGLRVRPAEVEALLRRAGPGTAPECLVLVAEVDGEIVGAKSPCRIRPPRRWRSHPPGTTVWAQKITVFQCEATSGELRDSLRSPAQLALPGSL